VVAAGGIASGRGLIAALALGAEAISMGSRFVVTREAPVPLNVKEHLIERTEEDTVITDNFTGVRCRVIKNEFVDNMLELARNGTDPWEIMQTGVGKIRQAYVEGDIEGGSLAFGQVCGLIQEIPTCQELLDNIIREAEEAMYAIGEKVGIQHLALAN
jgi:enoyl-[acyl-carrier protein] reductase II